MTDESGKDEFEKGKAAFLDDDYPYPPPDDVSFDFLHGFYCLDTGGIYERGWRTRHAVGSAAKA